MTLQEVKDKYAQDNWGYMKWDTAVKNYKVGISDEDIEEIAKRYASAKLIDASNHAQDAVLYDLDNMDDIDYKAAPDLLDILKRIVEMQEEYYGNGSLTHLNLISLVEEAKVAIKKATGDE